MVHLNTLTHGIMMGDFFNTYYHNNPEEAVRAALYGEYNYMDAYVRINVFGNLVSFNEWGYHEELEENEEEIVERYKELVEEGSIEDDYGFLEEE